MRYNILSVILLAAAILSGGCTDDELQPYPSQSSVPGMQGESMLQLAVESYDVNIQNGARAAEPSDTPEPENEDEKRILDFWMFQFSPDGTELAAPKYYEIVAGEAGKSTLDELTKTAYTDLTMNVPMTIYIVTNIHDKTWASDGTNSLEGFKTLQEVKAQKLPNPQPIRAGFENEKIIIPMSGQIDNVTNTGTNLIVVPVTRMYAKVKILVDFNDNNLKIYDVDVAGIPYYCKVSSMVDKLDEGGEPMAVPFPDNTLMISKPFSSSDALTEGNDKGWLVIYIPENIRGEVAGVDKVSNLPAEKVPKDALSVNIRAKYDGINYKYNFLIYPGENVKNNFNVRRNCVYRVIADVKGTTEQHTPSSNCFVVAPGEELQFEPYYRVETGGGFQIEDYIQNDPSKPEKVIDKVEIIWQTKDCIGDNTDGKLVYLGPDTGDKHRKIIVKTKKEGNALVAARNKDGEIIWSWHIWVTPNQPDNLANAVTYTTYRWEEVKYTKTELVQTGFLQWEWVEKEYEEVKVLADKPRIPGYAVMPCNLGALDFEPTALSENYPGTRDGSNGFPEYIANDESDYRFNNEYRTFGMVYQWGRKDPFPPVYYYTGGNNDDWMKPKLRYPHSGYLNYTDFYTDYHYANDNKKQVKKTAYLHTNYIGKKDYEVDTLFYSVFNRDLPGNGIIYGIKNPTVYIAATEYSNVNDINEKPDGLVNNGDWLPEGQSNDELWGGLKPDKSQKNMYIDKDADNKDIYMYDNYGDKKSVFDPCPTGWRVAPGELWLGFTRTGLNPEEKEEMSDVNWDSAGSGKNGMLMYMQDWLGGLTSYFPLQGTRVGIGFWFNNGWCGNYHNATCSMNNRVNILHLHQNALRMHIFEITNKEYYIKSTASPVRCVRDRK